MLACEFFTVDTVLLRRLYVFPARVAASRGIPPSRIFAKALATSNLLS
jgi:hypothetical protein